MDLKITTTERRYARTMTALPHLDRTLVMGIVNVTPDSFSDGGDHATPAEAIQHGLWLASEGADIIDVGGESTRPGATPVDVETEKSRVIEVVAALAHEGAVVSIDTRHAEVAQMAVAAGAILVNDVSGGRSDPAMLSTVAQLGVCFVLQHWRGPLGVDWGATYTDVVVDVRRELVAQVNAAIRAGIGADQLIIDPGLGFSKTSENNWTLLNHLDSFAELGCPLLIGASRKRFLGDLLTEIDGKARPPKERDDATVALTALLAERGIWGVRTHAVRAQRDAIAVAAQMAGSR